MGRDEADIRRRLQHDFQQIARIEPQDRPAVRSDVADLRQVPLDALHGREVRRAHHVVHLAHLAVVFVDATDLGGEHEPHFAAGVRLAIGLPQRGPQREQSLLGRHELFLQLRGPTRMRNIARSDDIDTLDPRPVVQVFGREVFTGRARIVRMDVEVCDQLHGPKR